MKKIYIIATEPSADVLGGSLMKELNSQTPVTWRGLGGREMRLEGLSSSLFCINSLAVMGLVELVPHVFRIHRLIKKTVSDILHFNPDVLITIDGPGFTGRVIDILRQKRVRFPIIHYVAPSVWAWRANRVKIWAQRADHLLCLLPFEPAYFLKSGLRSTAVGHPILEFSRVFSAKEKRLLLLPGSRLSEVKRHMPIFINAYERLCEKFPELTVVILTLPSLELAVRALLPDRLQECLLLKTGIRERFSWFEKSQYAISASGTATLELFYHDVKTVIAHRVSPLTGMIVRSMIKIPFFGLPNILANKEIMPECIQERCTSLLIANQMSRLIDEDVVKKTKIKEEKNKIARLLLPEDSLKSFLEDGITPSKIAVRIIMEYLNF